MSTRIASLSARRLALQERCALQREQLDAALAAIRPHVHSVERGFGAVRRIPLAALLIAAALAVASFATKRVFRAAGSVASIVGMIRRVLRSRR